MEETFSVVVPAGRADRYLRMALSDLQAQSFPAERFEIVVVDDDENGSRRRLVEEIAAAGTVTMRHVARRWEGLGAARNTGIERSRGTIVAFVDDDCRFPTTWLSGLARGAADAPRADCYGGPILATVEAPHPRWCGREPFPLTHLEYGPEDRWVDLVFGANMAVRRTALERIGAFNPRQPLYGDEIEWILRLRSSGGLVRYVAAAGVRHVRLGGDLSALGLIRLAHSRARGNVALDRSAGIADPAWLAALRAIRLGAHAVRWRCWGGAAVAIEHLSYAAHSLSRRLRSG